MLAKVREIPVLSGALWLCATNDPVSGSVGLGGEALA